MPLSVQVVSALAAVYVSLLWIKLLGSVGICKLNDFKESTLQNIPVLGAFYSIGLKGRQPETYWVSQLNIETGDAKE